MLIQYSVQLKFNWLFVCVYRSFFFFYWLFDFYRFYNDVWFCNYFMDFFFLCQYTQFCAVEVFEPLTLKMISCSKLDIDGSVHFFFCNLSYFKSNIEKTIKIHKKKKKTGSFMEQRFSAKSNSIFRFNSKRKNYSIHSTLNFHVKNGGKKNV